MIDDKDQNPVGDELMQHTGKLRDNSEADDKNSQRCLEGYLDEISLGSRLQDLQAHYARAVQMLYKIDSWLKSPYSSNSQAIVEDYLGEESQIFTEIPDYIRNDIELRKQKAPTFNKCFEPLKSKKLSSEGELHDFSRYSRVVISPEDPLPLPFDSKRFPNRKGMDRPGTYHDLFFGDGTNCLFPPPAETRFQLEARKEKKKEIATEPPNYDPPPKRNIVVSNNFVPACALVNHTAIQEQLRAKKRANAWKK